MRRDLVAIVDDSEGAHAAADELGTGANEAFDFGADQMVQEHLFVPKPGASGERDAWLVGVTLNTRARATELHVFDAARIGDGPVATWRSRSRRAVRLSRHVVFPRLAAAWLSGLSPRGSGLRLFRPQQIFRRIVDVGSVGAAVSRAARVRD